VVIAGEAGSGLASITKGDHMTSDEIEKLKSIVSVLGSGLSKDIEETALGEIQAIIRRVHLTDVFEECISKWNVSSQLVMAMEEAAEVITGITALCRGKEGALESLALEIVDMEIMLAQLVYILDKEYQKEYKTAKPGDYYELVASSKEFKIGRLKERLAGGRDDVEPKPSRK